MSSRRLAALGLAAGLAGGGTVGAALGLAAVSGAQTTDTPTTTEAPASGSEARPDAGSRWSDALQGLVDDGTLTEAQRDAVVDALREAGPSMRGPGHGKRGASLEPAADALGLTVDELREQLRDGTTVADLAAARGVDVQAVVDAIVADRQARVAEKVAAGEITQERADEILADAESRATAFVNGERPERGPGSRGGGRGPDREQSGSGGEGAPATDGEG